MIRPIIQRHRRHGCLHDALTELDRGGTPQFVPIPANVTPAYWQKYAHMVAQRSGMKISTRALKGRGGLAFMIVSQRTRWQGKDAQ